MPAAIVESGRSVPDDAHALFCPVGGIGPHIHPVPDRGSGTVAAAAPKDSFPAGLIGSRRTICRGLPVAWDGTIFDPLCDIANDVEQPGLVGRASTNREALGTFVAAKIIGEHEIAVVDTSVLADIAVGCSPRKIVPAA